MQAGHFYFIADEFYEALPGCNLMSNKVSDENGSHGRPCHYCFECEGLYWMVPISSKVEKYQRVYDSKMQRRGRCDGIRFGYVNGYKRAFLIQNCFPVTVQYVAEEYRIENNTIPVTINDDLKKELNGLVRKVVRLYNRGINITLIDLSAVMDFLNSAEQQSNDENESDLQDTKGTGKV